MSNNAISVLKNTAIEKFTIASFKLPIQRKSQINFYCYAHF